MKLDIKKYIKELKEKRKKEVEQLKTINDKYVPSLLIIQIGNDEASNRYVRGKINDCQDVGIKADLIKMDVFDFHKIHMIMDNYDGIILQEPSYTTAEEKETFLTFLDSRQDVDGFKRDSDHNSCTPQGIVDFLLNEVLVRDSFAGKTIAVIGKGELVGKPLVPMLMEKRATVINCNSTTPKEKMKQLTLAADIVISAVGKQNLITRDMLAPGAIVIDAGISFDENGKLCGDCDKSMYDDENVYISTVPGGVGLLTRMALVENVIKAKLIKIEEDIDKRLVYNCGPKKEVMAEVLLDKKLKKELDNIFSMD